MFTRFSQFNFVIVALTLLLAAPTNAEDLRFTGNESERTDVFAVEGPWLLDWSARSPSRLPCNFEAWSKDGTPGLPCNFELRLFDADSGDFVGTIAQLEGEGRGLKLFESGGSFRIDVVSQHVLWELLVKPVDEERAAALKKLTEKGPSLADRSMAAAREVAAHSFVSWRPVDDSTLLLFAADEAGGYRVTFTPGCKGLANATALSFVTGGTSVGSYNSILLDDGTQCYFDRVIPTVFD